MEEERLLILQMVEEGKITSSEAAELLQALEEHARTEHEIEEFEVEKDVQRRIGSFEERMERMGEDIERAATDFAERLEHQITDKVEKLPGFIEKLLESIGGGSLAAFIGPGYEFTEELAGEFDAEAGRPIEPDFSTKNGRIELESWDQPGYKVVLVKKVKASTEEEAAELAVKMVEVKSEHNRLEIKSKEHGVGIGAVQGGVRIKAYLPRKFMYSTILRSANGRITVEDLVLTRAQLNTSNGRIVCSGVTARDVEARTSNGRIILDRVIGNVVARTSNGSIRVGTVRVEKDADYDLATSNGSVRIRPEIRDDIGYSVEASTSLGRIKTDLPGLAFDEDNRRRHGRKSIKAHTEGFDEKPIKVRIRATTTNGSVRIGAVDID